jgi:hypothetical protein
VFSVETAHHRFSATAANADMFSIAALDFQSKK